MQDILAHPRSVTAVKPYGFGSRDTFIQQRMITNRNKRRQIETMPAFAYESDTTKCPAEMDSSPVCMYS